MRKEPAFAVGAANASYPILCCRRQSATVREESQLEVAHIDGHADLGLGDPSWIGKAAEPKIADFFDKLCSLMVGVT
jgi:hypothetical protein